MADETTRSVEGQPLAEEDVQHFDSSFLKIDRNGAQVLSNTLEPGERLATEQEDKEQARQTVGEDHLPKEGEALNSTDQNAPAAVQPGPAEPPSVADQGVQEKADAAPTGQQQQTPAQQKAAEPPKA